MYARMHIRVSVCELFKHIFKFYFVKHNGFMNFYS